MAAAVHSARAPANLTGVPSRWLEVPGWPTFDTIATGLPEHVEECRRLRRSRVRAPAVLLKAVARAGGRHLYSSSGPKPVTHLRVSRQEVISEADCFRVRGCGVLDEHSSFSRALRER